MSKQGIKREWRELTAHERDVAMQAQRSRESVHRIPALRTWSMDNARNTADWLRRLAIIADKRGDYDVARERRIASTYWLAYEPGFYGMNGEQA